MRTEAEPDIQPDRRGSYPMQALILAAVAILSLSAGMAEANTQYHATAYHAPAQNYHQNNWMSSNR